MTRIFLSDHGGNFDAFCEACYQAYLQFWQGNPTLQNKRIMRQQSLGNNERENVFWGIMDGHDPQNQNGSLEKYEKIPCLAYLLEAIAQQDPDVKWFRIRNKGKVRIEIFSQTHRYFMVLQEGRHVYNFITAHPMSQRTFSKSIPNHLLP